MKNILYSILLLSCFSCQKEKPPSSPLNPEIMAFVKSYNDLLVREDLLQKKRYAIFVHVENRFDTIKIYVEPLNNYNWVIKLGEPTFEDNVGKRRVYIYAPQFQYLFPNRQKVKIDPTYFSKTDTIIGCMIPNLTLKRYEKDSIVGYTDLFDSPISRKLVPPPPPPISPKFKSQKID